MEKFNYSVISRICAVYDRKAKCWDLPFNLRTEEEVKNRQERLNEKEPDRYELKLIAIYKDGKIVKSEDENVHNN